MDTIARPDQAYYEAVVAELQLTKTDQARLALVKAYDDTPVPGLVVGNHKDRTVYDIAFAAIVPARRPARGKALADQITGAAARRSLLEDELAKWNAAEQAALGLDAKAS